MKIGQGSYRNDASIKIIDCKDRMCNRFKRILHFYVISAVEIPTFFANVEVKFDGQPFYKVNGNVDQCIASGFECPYLPGSEYEFLCSC